MTAALSFLLAAAVVASAALGISRAAALRGCDEVCVITRGEGGR